MISNSLHTHLIKNFLQQHCGSNEGEYSEGESGGEGVGSGLTKRSSGNINTLNKGVGTNSVSQLNGEAVCLGGSGVVDNGVVFVDEVEVNSVVEGVGVDLGEAALASGVLSFGLWRW